MNRTTLKAILKLTSYWVLKYSNPRSKVTWNKVIHLTATIHTPIRLSPLQGYNHTTDKSSQGGRQQSLEVWGEVFQIFSVSKS